jgi:hypothetical protein
VAARKRKGKWTLRHLKIEVNLLIAKVGVLFSRDEPPKRSRKARVRQGQQIVQAEFRIIQSEAPRDIGPYLVRATPTKRQTSVSCYSPFGVDTNGLPKNILGDTILAIAGGARVKAVRTGDIATAIGAAIVEQVLLDSARKSQEGTGSGQYWR